MDVREREIFDLVEPGVASQGVDLVEVALGGGRRRTVIRIVVHSEAGVTHADCARVTRIVGRTLDESRVVPGSYLLEVSSPGTDRVMKEPREFELFRGRPVRLRLVDTAEEIAGRAAGTEGDDVVLARDDGTRDVLPWPRIAKARLAEEPPAPGTGRGQRA